MQPSENILQAAAGADTHELPSVLHEGSHLVEAAHVEGGVGSGGNIAPRMQRAERTDLGLAVALQDVQHVLLVARPITAGPPRLVAAEIGQRAAWCGGVCGCCHDRSPGTPRVKPSAWSHATARTAPRRPRWRIPAAGSRSECRPRWRSRRTSPTRGTNSTTA